MLERLSGAYALLQVYEDERIVGDTAQAALLLERARDMWAELKRETDVARTLAALAPLHGYAPHRSASHGARWGLPVGAPLPKAR